MSAGRKFWAIVCCGLCMFFPWYISVVKPMYHQFIEPTKRYADVVIPEGVTNTVAIDLINTKVASILKESQKA